MELISLIEAKKLEILEKHKFYFQTEDLAKNEVHLPPMHFFFCNRITIKFKFLFVY